MKVLCNYFVDKVLT